MQPRQFALPFEPQPLTRARWIAATSNADADAALARWRSWPGHVFALVGPEGAGKSHRAQIWADEAGGARHDGSVLTMEAVGALADAAGGAIALDNADRAPDAAALFHLWNLVAQSHGALLLVGRHPPGEWGSTLADLFSRLASAPWAMIQAPDMTLMATMLERLSRDRQIRLTAGLVDFLLPRLERSYAGVGRFVAALDAALSEPNARLNQNLAARVLDGLYVAETDS
jgi:chromosomal replication initiation ATPase DnaA